MGASYNPRTGTYARGAAAYGPYGSRAAGQAYNPRTGTYAQTRQGSNVYGNWGASSVQRGDDWAQTAHRENYRNGTNTGVGRTSNGGAAVARTGPAGNTAAIRTGSGDVYAGRDGNVYRKTEGGGWEQNNGSGGWSPTDPVNRPTPSNSAGDRTAGTTAATNRSSSSSSPEASQLNRDSGARSTGNDRVSNRSSWSSGGSTRSGAGSYGGGGARSGGGRRR